MSESMFQVDLDQFWNSLLSSSSQSVAKGKGLKQHKATLRRFYNTIAEISDMQDTRLTIGTKSIDDVEHF